MQCTKVGPALSSYSDVCSGVVQRSCLGPLLFVLYINDIVDIFSKSIISKRYANDLKLYTTLQTDDDYDALHRGLTELEKWFAVWQLHIAVRKCSVLPIGLRDTSAKRCLRLLGNTLPVSNIVNDLEIVIDSQLKFSCQVNAMVAKAHSRACLIHKSFLCKNQKILTKDFITYVRPLVEYASCIWSPSTKTLIKKIKSVQKRFTKMMRVIANLTYKERLEKQGLESLERRRLRFDLIFVYNICYSD